MTKTITSSARIILLIGLFLNLACNTHYGHRAKVRVGKHEDPTSVYKKDKTDKPAEETLEIDQSELSASLDSLVDPKSRWQTFNYNQVNKSNEIVGSKQIDKPKDKKDAKSIAKQRPDKTPINYYAKWAFILGLISLVGAVFVIPFAIGPLALFLGIKALKEIRKSGERGKGMAYFGLTIGFIFTLIIVVSFLSSLEVDLGLGWLLLVVLPYVLVFLLNLVIYKTIKRSKKNPANIDSPGHPFKPQNSGWKAFLITLLSLMIAANIFFLIIMASGGGSFD